MQWKLALAACLLCIPFVGLLLLSAPAGAQGVGPTIPWTVYGQATFNGVAVNPGTLVEARNPVTGTQCGQTSAIDGGNYSVDVEGAGQTTGCLNDGDPVQFRILVGGVFTEALQSPAGQTFQSGEVSSLDLAVDTGTPPPCPDFSDPPGVWLEDILAIAARWHQRSTDPAWDARFDLNGDEVITIEDITMVAMEWGTTCP